MVQLWVNLPRKDKLGPAGYRGITDAQIPKVALGDDAGSLRVIAGEYEGHAGPARTFSPDPRLGPAAARGQDGLAAAAGGLDHLVVVLDGTVQVNGEAVLRPAQMATLSTAGSGPRSRPMAMPRSCCWPGEPIDEPVVGYGPFVMTSQQEIMQAIADFNGGKVRLHGRSSPTSARPRAGPSETPMVHLLGISGSLRVGSYNTALLQRRERTVR